MTIKRWLTRNRDGGYWYWECGKLVPKPLYDTDLTWTCRGMSRFFEQVTTIVKFNPDLKLPRGKKGICELVLKKGKLERISK